MKLLALETASEACSVALWTDGEVHERHVVEPRRHAALVLGMVAELLDGAGLRLSALDALAFGRGPGAFTGVRIATGVVQGLALGADLPVVAVSTLQALAAGAMTEAPEGHVLAAFDARMGEVYIGAYRGSAGGEVVAVAAEQVCAPQAFDVAGDAHWIGVGSGFATYDEVLRATLGDRLVATLPERLPRAADVARLAVPRVLAGDVTSAERALPVYLRDQVATPRARR